MAHCLGGHETMKVGDRLKLKGRTQKGKNKVTNEGELWSLLQIKQNVPCVNGPAMMIGSDKGDMRWVQQTNDPDFTIENLAKKE
jgi:hypothetical protein